MKHSLSFRLLFIIVACIAIASGVYFYHHKEEKPIILATVLDHPRAINPFRLEEANQKSFTQENLKGHWTMLFFGFTSCPHLCPTTMTELNNMVRLLEKEKVKTVPQVIMITVDPEKDTPAKMKEYASVFNPNFIGLSGDKGQIETMTRELGVVYLKVANSGNMFDHSGTIMLFNPNGELVALFTAPHQAKVLAQDFETIVKKN
ncbi:MAG: SCO family protein [Proteobacteria bacterium]|nr:SCO family protein [Pseudomonadota bacterium]